MTQALFTGATGLKAFQRQLDVVANNLANLNTTGFKNQRVHFSDLVYRTHRAGNGSESDSIGGTNPVQTGTGVRVSQISRQFTQGSLQSTEQPLDFAIRGNGFFVVENENGESLFTRAGSFGLDGNGNLVDPATGYLVQRSGTYGEADGTEQFGFQIANETSINIPIGAPVPGQLTSSIAIGGNLPSFALPPNAEILSTENPFEIASGPASEASRFSDLSSNDSQYVAGDVIEINGTDLEGTPFEFSIDAELSTIGDLLNGLNQRLPNSTATLTSEGHLEIVAEQTGDAFLSLVIQDASTNQNFSNFDGHLLNIVSDGNSGDEFENVTQVFDEQGNSYDLSLVFQKTSNNSWQVSSSVIDDDARIEGNQSFDLQFAEDGSFSFLTADNGNNEILVQTDSRALPQNISLDLGSLTHIASGFGLTPQQDGFPPGILAAVEVDAQGRVAGLATNGVEIPIAQL